MIPVVISRCALPAVSVMAGVVLGAAGMAGFSSGLDRHSRSADEAAPAALAVSWKNIADPDTAKFAENLRAIGCPENTISRILTCGDMAAMAAASSSAPIVDNPVSSPTSPLPVAVPLPPVPAAAATFAAPAPEVVIVAPQGCVPLPVAFQELPQDVQMSAVERVKLNAIQEDFLAAIGGASQDPASSQYLERWRQAQPKCDQAFKAAFGQAAFLRRYMAAVRAQQSAAPGS